MCNEVKKCSAFKENDGCDHKQSIREDITQNWQYAQVHTHTQLNIVKSEDWEKENPGLKRGE